ncbi:MAG TPA: 16S rRNA (cytosine(1402)-N(4))-methyltransferase RsmH [Candidatus Paceibacterota bacterium]
MQETNANFSVSEHEKINVHKSVLLHEVISGLDIHKGEIYLDGTLGSGGHARYALEKAEGALTIIGLDRDKVAIDRARKNLDEIKNIESKIFLKNVSYGDLNIVLDELGINKVDKILFDLGLSSDQFETSGRGFTFKRDEPLLMTFQKDILPDDITAKYIVNNWGEETLADIIYGYGEERYSRKIAKNIVSYRKKKSIETTFELVDIIQHSVPDSYKRGRIHPATRTFQALRIAVNDELNTLKQGLNKGFERLKIGGRMAVISFHSLEDRIVKHFYKEKEGIKIITKKPIVPSDEEIKENPRSRSAKLRIMEKIEIE